MILIGITIPTVKIRLDGHKPAFKKKKNGFTKQLVNYIPFCDSKKIAITVIRRFKSLIQNTLFYQSLF